MGILSAEQQKHKNLCRTLQACEKQSKTARYKYSHLFILVHILHVRPFREAKPIDSPDQMGLHVVPGAGQKTTNILDCMYDELCLDDEISTGFTKICVFYVSSLSAAT
jgi:hypothetical protein